MSSPHRLSVDGTARWPALLLALAVAVVYWNSLHGAFVWDDVPTIVESKSFERLSTVFDRPAQVTTASGRPLLNLSLAFNYAISGRNVVGFHVLNILIHLGAALALFGLVRRTLEGPTHSGRLRDDALWIAFVIAALWALHPLQTEAVTYIVQRTESLMGLCYLLTLYCLVRSFGSDRPLAWRTGSVAAAALGMMAKEVMVSVPVIALLFDVLFFGGSWRKVLTARKGYYAALFATWIILAWLVISLGGNRDGGTGGFSGTALWLAYWLTQLKAIAVYLKLTFFPSPLIFQYGTEWVKDPRTIIPYGCVVLPLVALTFWALWQRPKAGFLAFWFFSVLAPTSVIPGTVDMIVEHRMYLALAPLLAGLVWAGYWLAGRGALLVLAGAACILGVVTVARNEVYRSRLDLWTDNVAKRPENGLARYNLAAELLANPGRNGEAVIQLREVVKRMPNFAPGHYNLGVALQRGGHGDEEVAGHFAEALQSDPGMPEAHHALGIIQLKAGRLPEAEAAFRAALLKRPDFAAARLNLARTLDLAGRIDEAVATYRTEILSNPNEVAAKAELGILLGRVGKADEAIHLLEEALQANPELWQAQLCLGTLYLEKTGNEAKAAASLRKVILGKPTVAEAHFNLGNALVGDPQTWAQAVEEYREAIRLRPNYADARYNLAAALQSDPRRKQEAIDEFRQVVRLQPNSADARYSLARLLAADPGTRADAINELKAAVSLNPDFREARALLDEQLRAAPGTQGN